MEYKHLQNIHFCVTEYENMQKKKLIQISKQTIAVANVNGNENESLQVLAKRRLICIHSLTMQN